MLYFAQIHSILTYGLLIWGNMVSPTTLNKLQRLQNKAVQLIDPKKCLNVIYHEQRILPISKLIQLENFKVWFKYYATLLPVRLHEMMAEDSKAKSITKKHKYNTRQKFELNLPYATGLYKNSFFVKGLKEFTSLPTEIKSSKNVFRFVNKFKNFLINKQ